MASSFLTAFVGLLSLSAASKHTASMSILEGDVRLQGNDSAKCPPCFNCMLPLYSCAQYATCNEYNGKCQCPPGFGADDCSQPVCGSLADGKERSPREGHICDCDEGWEGINCNVCKTNSACDKLMPNGEGGICYKQGVMVNENFQICDVTNRMILELLKEKKPQVTFSCNAHEKECNFQFWVDQKESFYCALDTCSWEEDNDYEKNSTSYKCDNIACKCIPDRMLCGEDGSIDLGEFLKKDIKGPASFSCLSTEGGSTKDGCQFQEPAMNGLIKNIFGDESITLNCHSGECLYKFDVPGYARPIKKINTPLIAGVIAGCALFVVGVTLLVWYLSRRSLQRRGPIHLNEDSDDESAKLMADHKPASLFFDEVSYNLNGRQILSGIQGVVHSGELMAIMGASGAGKTTFLDLLARKNKRGQVQGKFLINGEKLSDENYRSLIGFVDQEDTMLPTLTVHETITTSAFLRLPRDMSQSAKEQRVYEVEKQLGIWAIRDQIIGSEEGSGRGISGGEKRRVGIACELVTSPSILFLDEPTSGLDAFNAFNVVECLVTLAKQYNRTVIFTIHQPRSNIVALFDQLVLLAQGRLVYSGQFAKCQNYFDQIGYACPPGFNIADYLVDLTMHASRPHISADENQQSLPTSDDVSFKTRSSSVRAVKSIPSVSNISVDNSFDGSAGSSLRRPKHGRRDSLRQRQDRHLYTRKRSVGFDTSASGHAEDDDAPLEDFAANSQRLDDLHQLPPATTRAPSDLDVLVSAYVNSDVAKVVKENIQSAVTSAHQANGGPMNGNALPNGDAVSGTIKGYQRISYGRQFLILSQRTWRNLYRNPMLMLTHYAIAILLAVLCGFLFYGLTDDIKGFQNRLGLFFFILALFGFSTLTSLTVFASERLLFVRERANGYYSPATYFAAKVIFDIIPLRLVPPFIMGSIVYPMVGLIPAWPQFFKFILILVLFNLAAAAICLFIGLVVKDGGVANLVGSLVMLFSLLFAGLLLNHDAIPPTALWLQKLSIFHYAFEGLIVNEVKYLTLIDHKYGLDLEVPGATILSSFGFDVLALWADVLGLGVISVAFIGIGFLAMYFLLVEKR